MMFYIYICVCVLDLVKIQSAQLFLTNTRTVNASLINIQGRIKYQYYKEINLCRWTSVFGKKQACDSSRWVCEMCRARVVLNST